MTTGHWASVLFGALVAVIVQEFLRTRQDSRPLWTLWGEWAFAAFAVPLVVLLTAKTWLPAEAGMRLMLLTSWVALGLAACRTLERFVMRRVSVDSRAAWLAGAISITVAVVGGIAIPLAALDRVAAPRSVEAFAVTILCTGVRVPSEGIAPTVYVDDRYPMTYVADADGRVTYDLPVYWQAYRMELPKPDNSGVERIENWTQGLQGVYPEVLGTLFTFGLMRDSLNYVEGGWELREQQCTDEP
ncbi:hypothetical protein E1I21_03780 [Microbacterium oleivorans]|uniref:hypothetical protein n=1 Tax=Microbacterium oleivorans TaxID=273677 RepID=UPI0010A33DCA|nr:hypothetical protein [Microbacterium oleivorans]THE08266.1 hypothetical protein E1I21_03780 [Microbacterium oleivorans]